MPTNYVKPGDMEEFAAPTGGVVSGGLYKIGAIVGVATETKAQTERCNFGLTGTWTVNKVQAEAWTEGQLIYWNSGSARASSTSTTSLTLGISTEVVASGVATAKVRLNGVGTFFNQ